MVQAPSIHPFTSVKRHQTLPLPFLGQLSWLSAWLESLVGVRIVKPGRSWTSHFTMISAINMSLAFCMGSDLDILINSDQPMATIFFNSFGTKATLGLWAIVVLVQ
jgi:hypothetical protein